MPRPVENPPNPWQSTHVDWLGEPPPAKLEIFEEEAKSILSDNDSPDVGFTWSVNCYRGCYHGCVYCLSGDTKILMGDGTTRPIRALRVGDEIIGTVRRGRYLRYETTKVLAHWETFKPAWRVVLADGTELVSSGDHRFLSERGWKYVAPAAPGKQRPFLTTNNSLVGTGAFAEGPIQNEAYQRGYLRGMVRGDGLLKSDAYERKGRAHGDQHQFRPALIDLPALQRSRAYLQSLGVETNQFVLQKAAVGDREMQGIRTHAKASVEDVHHLIAVPDEPDDAWFRGFLAGIFDAEGSYSQGILRISSTDESLIALIGRGLSRLGIPSVVERIERARPVSVVRITGGLREHLRFFHSVAPAITRKTQFAGSALKHACDLRVVRVEPLGVEMPMFDITTGTGDFIANGVVSHNCYARPSHQYLGFGAGSDFERKIVVKTNAPKLLHDGFMKPSWKGETVCFSGNTDCYQPLEASYELTRQCLEVCLRFQNPVSMITKGALIRRDVELLQKLTRVTRVHVFISVPFADDETARKIEPYASTITARLDAMKTLADAGIPVGVAVAPVIPGLSESHIAPILERAWECGARRAFTVLVRLPSEVLPVFNERIEAVFSPSRVRHIRSAILDVRDGKMNNAAFGERMRGVGPRYEALRQLFEHTCKRLGFNETGMDHHGDDEDTTFVRPGTQLSLI